MLMPVCEALKLLTASVAVIDSLVPVLVKVAVKTPKWCQFIFLLSCRREK